MSDTNRTKNTNEIITGYKAFDPDFTCRGYQYEVGKTFEHNGKIQMCSKGFHFCHKAPIDVFNYYPLVGENGELLTRFAKVSATREGSVVDRAGHKCVTSKISIDKEITLDELLKEQVDKAYKSKGETELLIATEDGAKLADEDSDTKIISNKKGTHVALTWDYSMAVASADCTYLASSGFGTGLFATGKCPRLSSSGNGSTIYSRGSYSSTAASGAVSQLRITGDETSVASSGAYSVLNVTGINASVSSSGRSTALNVTGANANVSSSGSFFKLTAKGDFVATALSGERAELRITGNETSVASSGAFSELTVTGNDARIASVGGCSRVTYEGENGVITVLGYHARFKGSEGTIVLAVTYDFFGKPRGGLVGRIGEDGLKPDTLYTVKNGEFVEVGA